MDFACYYWKLRLKILDVVDRARPDKTPSFFLYVTRGIEWASRGGRRLTLTIGLPLNFEHSYSPSSIFRIALVCGRLNSVPAAVWSNAGTSRPAGRACKLPQWASFPQAAVFALQFLLLSILRASTSFIAHIAARLGTDGNLAFLISIDELPTIVPAPSFTHPLP